MQDDTKLIKKAQKGNHEAFISVMKKYEVRLYNLAKKYLQNEHDVADVLQETTISAFENLKKLNNPQYFYTWVCRILINNCKKILLKKQHTYANEIPEATEEMVQPTKIDLNEAMTMNQFLQSLQDTYRIPLILYYYNGFSVKEISAVLAEPEGTVKSKLSRGRNLLKKMYLKAGGD